MLVSSCNMLPPGGKIKITAPVKTSKYGKGYLSSQIPLFENNLANSILGDKHDCGHLCCTNANMAIFSKIVEQIKFVKPRYH